MRRRGLEAPPSYPGPGPQPCRLKRRSVQIVQERPDRMVAWTIWTHQTIWMLPPMLPRLAGRRGRRCKILSPALGVGGNTEHSGVLFRDTGTLAFAGVSTF